MTHPASPQAGLPLSSKISFLILRATGRISSITFSIGFLEEIGAILWFGITKKTLRLSFHTLVSWYLRQWDDSIKMWLKFCKKNKPIAENISNACFWYWGYRHFFYILKMFILHILNKKLSHNNMTLKIIFYNSRKNIILGVKMLHNSFNIQIHLRC